VPERAVVDASPLILLSKAGLLDFLRLDAGMVFVPDAVAREVRAHRHRAGRKALDNTPWLRVVRVPGIPPVVEAWDLGAGESSVLAWARAHPGTAAILDDLAARRCAATMGIPLRGTLGLVLLAKKRRLIPAARPVMARLREAGLYLSDRTLDEALALVGE
jgi:predicted nucleic acid-binding protein